MIELFRSKNLEFELMAQVNNFDYINRKYRKWPEMTLKLTKSRLSKIQNTAVFFLKG